MAPPAHQKCITVTRQGACRNGFPRLIFLSGLDGAPLGKAHVDLLDKQFEVISICTAADDRSDWDTLTEAVAEVISVEAKEGKSPIVLIGESFGAALALRSMAAVRNPSDVAQLVIINSGTALANDLILSSVTSLLPLLRVDGNGRVLYGIAALVLYKMFLVDERRLRPECVPGDGSWLSRTVDINAVPLETMLHRVQLLRNFKVMFGDNCLQRLVKVPTTIVASKQDKLLASENEARRLQQLLPNVERSIFLEQSSHACLLEKNVSIASFLRFPHPNRATAEVKAKPSMSAYKAPQIVNTGSRLSSNSSQRRSTVNSNSLHDFQEAFKIGQKTLAPWKALVKPVFHGTHFVSEAMEYYFRENQPILFVGNHGVYGILDTPLIIEELNILMGGPRLRPLAYETHFNQFSRLSGGRWGWFCEAIGAVRATPRNYYKLLRQGEPILLFPGGPTEVCRRRGQQNMIFWKEKTDFVRPAVQMNAVIVPFSCVGADDSVNIIADGQEMLETPLLGHVLRRTLVENRFDPEYIMPLGVMSRIKPFQIEFHRPILTSEISSSDTSACAELYDQIRRCVQDGITRLVEDQASLSKSRRPAGHHLALPSLTDIERAVEELLHM